MRMGSLNYHHLQYFWVVAREGSITRATKVLHLTQPAISTQIRTLETSLGQKLFSRRGRELVLTEAGETAFRYADEIFSLGKEFLDVVHGESTDAPIRFAVGVQDTLTRSPVYRLLKPAFKSERPLKLVCRTAPIARLMTDLSAHALDFVLADAPAQSTDRSKIRNHLLAESPVTVLGVPALADKYRRNFPQSLDGAPFLLQPPGAGLRRALDAFFASAGIRPVLAGEIEDSALLKVFAQGGLGLIAVPQLMADQLKKAYGFKAAGTLEGVAAKFWGISVQRKTGHPGVAELVKA